MSCDSEVAVLAGFTRDYACIKGEPSAIVRCRAVTSAAIHVSNCLLM